jgi:signal transduction histidine kinase
VKFSPQGESVTISIEAQAAEGVVKVRDNGPGIRPQDHAVIFQRHFQTAGGALHHLAPYGLGLSITKELLERQGGRIWLESSPGAGSTFFISLPRPREAD